MKPAPPVTSTTLIRAPAYRAAPESLARTVAPASRRRQELRQDQERKGGERDECSDDQASARSRSTGRRALGGAHGLYGYVWHGPVGGAVCVCRNVDLRPGFGSRWVGDEVAGREQLTPDVADFPTERRLGRDR